jgi:hypothetical protein
MHAGPPAAFLTYLQFLSSLQYVSSGYKVYVLICNSQISLALLFTTHPFTLLS